MKKNKLLILGISILLVFGLVLTGCDNGGSIGGVGDISGQITYDNGDVQGTKVILLNKNPESASSYEELNIVEVKTINNNEGTYLFDGLSSGTYFVGAYKDENGSGELEFSLEPANIYGVDDPESIEVKDSTVTGINIDLSYEEGDHPQYTVIVKVAGVLAFGGESEDLEDATVVLYGKSGKQIETGTTDVKGELSFDNIFDGEYYLEVTAGDDIYKGAILPYYRLLDMVTDDDLVRFGVPLFADSVIDTLYGSDAEDELLLGSLEVDAGESVTLNPSVSAEDIAYELNESETEEMIFDFSSNAFPSSPLGPGGYLIGIKNLSPLVDEYTLSITVSGVEEVISFPIKENRLITVIDQSLIYSR